jgi:hypothetical protein
MQNILPVTFLHNNKSTKDCTQFLIESEDGCLSRFSFMVFNATLINISVISLRSVLLVEESGVPRE